MRRKAAAIVEKILLRVAIYIRVSTDRQVKEGDSMRDQLATGQRYIDSHGNRFSLIHTLMTESPDKNSRETIFNVSSTMSVTVASTSLFSPALTGGSEISVTI